MSHKNDVDDFDQNDRHQDLPKEARASVLEAEAYATDLMEVERPYLQDELDSFKNNLVDNCVILNDYEEKLATIKAEFKEKMKPVERVIAENIQKLKQKVSRNVETVFMVANHETGMMDVIDCNGVWLKARKLYPNERQTNIHQMDTERKAG